MTPLRTPRLGGGRPLRRGALGGIVFSVAALVAASPALAAGPKQGSDRKAEARPGEERARKQPDSVDKDARAGKKSGPAEGKRKAAPRGRGKGKPVVEPPFDPLLESTASGGARDFAVPADAPGARRAAAPEAAATDDETRAMAAVVRARRPLLHACYLRALRTNSMLAGKLVLDVTVGAEGKVTALATRQEGMDDAGLAACVESQVRSFPFPAPEAGEARFTTPLVFQPKEL